MQLSPRRHELLSVYMLGFGTLFLYLGYHTQSFISESIIHSVHLRDPHRISGYAGYYGQAIHYSAFAISSLFTASLQHYLASKWMLVLATVFFACTIMVKEHIWQSIRQGVRLSQTLVLKQPSDIREGLAKTSIHPNMILLTFTFLHMGLLVSFFLGIYPTTLSFTASLAKDVYIVALYSCSAGLAEVFGGVFIRPLIKMCHSYKLIVTVALHFAAVVAALALFQLSVPERATIEPTHDNALWFTPSRTLACIFGFLVGMADFTLTMARAVICQKAVPQHRIEVFSLTRIHQ
ncbi:hypothetical protein TELCIR_17182, partial [Teladorsagia circumcincta]